MYCLKEDTVDGNDARQTEGHDFVAVVAKTLWLNFKAVAHRPKR
jgi:hypothetical protein